MFFCRFRAISQQLVATKEKIREAMRLAYHLQAESKFQMGNYNQHIIENVTQNSVKYYYIYIYLFTSIGRQFECNSNNVKIIKIGQGVLELSLIESTKP